MIGFQKQYLTTHSTQWLLCRIRQKHANGFLDSSLFINEDAKKQMKESIDFAKKARDDFKAVDDGYAKFEQMFDQK